MMRTLRVLTGAIMLVVAGGIEGGYEQAHHALLPSLPILGVAVALIVLGLTLMGVKGK